MTVIELRAELFREMNPLLDNESAMTKMLAFVKSLVPAQKGIKRITPSNSQSSNQEYAQSGRCCLSQQ